MKYIYQARTKDGKQESGTIEASSRDSAVETLSKYDIFVTSLVEDESAGSSIFKKKIKLLKGVSKKDLAIFSRQLAVMLDSRVPVVQSLNGLVIQTKKENLKEKIVEISKLVQEGTPLSDAFEKFPDIFNTFFVSLIRTGEASGKISESLYYLSDHLEREYDINSQIKGAMIYPAFVISVLGVVMIVIMVGVMPKLIELIKQSSSQPPFFTLLMLGFYQFLMGYWWVILLIFLALIGFGIYYFRTKAGKMFFDKYSLLIPFIGEFFKKTFLIRFAESISTLISAGLPINRALSITKDTVGNYIYKDIVTEIEKGVSEGEKINTILSKYPKYVAPFVIQMIQVGEETGKLDKNLVEIVNFYQKDVKRAIDSFTALLEPILIIVLGAIVALLAVSVLSPLYSTLGTL